MDINDLTPQEKSVLLARAMGWEIQKSHNEYTYDVYFNGERIAHMPDHTEGNLYDPANMGISYLLMQWVNELMANGLDKPDDFDAIINAFNDFHLPAKKWLAGWLDAIYLMVEDNTELVIEAGLVAEEERG